MEFIWGGLAVLAAVISYLSLYRQKSSALSSRKSRQAKAMREAFKSMSTRTAPVSNADGLENSKDSMEISQVSLHAGTSAVSETPSRSQIYQLWVYPIKSLRGCSVPSAMLTPEGFYLDRRFMLLKHHKTDPPKLENMHITTFPQMCLFHTSISDNTLTVTYRPPSNNNSSSDSSYSLNSSPTLEIPLDPDSQDFEHLDTLDITMHFSSTRAYNMGSKYNDFFSTHFGFPVILAFWGLNPRPVLGNNPGRRTGPQPPSIITKALSYFPILGHMFEPDGEKIAFNDCAPYLVISSSSVADLSSRLPSSIKPYDLTKLRSNIVLQTTESAYSEDYWSELTFSDTGAKILLTGNCGRCASLNTDYETGKQTGTALKLLQKDRRVDEGTKYSPIFGRYGFVSKGEEGRVVRVGERVCVSGRNQERTKFCEFLIDLRVVSRD